MDRSFPDVFAHVGEPGTGIRVSGTEVQELVEVALLPGDPAAERVNQLKVEADMADDIVRRVFSEAAENGHFIVKAFFNPVTDGRIEKLFRGDIINVFLGRITVDTEDIYFIRIAEDIAVSELLFTEGGIQPVSTVAADGKLEDFCFLFC